MLRKLKQILHRFKMRKKCFFGKNAVIDSAASFHGGNKIGSGTTFLNSELGYASYIGNNGYIKNTVIGKYCCIADDVMTVSGKHPSSKFVSIHPAFYSTALHIGFSYVDKEKFSDFEYIDATRKISITIGNDVWIGARSTILEGVKIGDGAIIATSALVVKDVPPYAIVGGVPARVIKYRFTNDEIESLLKVRWWDKDEYWIKQHADDFDDISKLFKVFE